LRFGTCLLILRRISLEKRLTEISIVNSATSQLVPLSLSTRTLEAKEPAISFLMQQGVENPDVISLAAGLVDYASLPIEETLAAAQRLLGNPAAARIALQYGTTAGSDRLRRLLCDHFCRLEGGTPASIGLDRSRVILTTGSQQLLSLVCEVLFDPGDICLVAGPTYFVFCGNLDGVGARPVTIEQDDEGMRADLLEQQLTNLEAAGQLDRVKMIYVVSYYDNPSGRTVSKRRRQQIIEIAKRFSKQHRILVLEDAAYRELRYDGPEEPSLWSFDPGGSQVIYTQTFSKSFAPGVRIGFGVIPDDLVKPLLDRKGNEDFGSANLNQHLLATVLEPGTEDAAQSQQPEIHYAKHLAQVQDAYRAKRDAMLAAADQYFADLPGVSWVHPHGGLYVWMTLPDEIETGFNSSLFVAAAQKHKVMYVPGELCYATGTDPHPRNQMRLSYGVQSPEGISEGMKRLAAAVREQLS